MEADTQTPAEPAAGDGFEWAVVEVFGHRRHAGQAREEERFGAKMLRIDIPNLEWTGEGDEAKTVVTGWTSHLYGGGSIFSYTPTDEATAMRINKPYRAPSRYRLPAAMDQSPDSEMRSSPTEDSWGVDD
jgi:hypothetical protein